MRKLAGVKEAATVFRALDKLAMRKEYHEALARNGISLDSIVSGIKGLCESSGSDATKLRAYQTLLTSLGLDKYEKTEETVKSWEDAVLQNSDTKQLGSGETEEYDVDVPKIPKTEERMREEEKKIASELYAD